MIATILANQWAEKAKAKHEDFVPDFWGEKEPADNTRKMLAFARAFSAATKARK